MKKEILEKAYLLSKEARSNSYSPYSNFKVGASLICENETIITGCNIENVSYGATICAERVAITKAISSGIKNFDAIIVTTDLKNPSYPCALCLQVLSELCQSDLKIFLANMQGIKDEYTLTNFLPLAFKTFKE